MIYLLYDVDESNAVVAPSPAPTPTLHPIQHQHQHHNHHNHNQASSSSSTGSVVVLQRTLQLLTYLVSHDEACKHYFTRPSATPWTIRRRTDKKTGTLFLYDRDVCVLMIVWFGLVSDYA